MNLCYAALPTSEDIQLLQEIANKFTLSYSAFLLLSYKVNKRKKYKIIDNIYFRKKWTLLRTLSTKFYRLFQQLVMYQV